MGHIAWNKWLVSGKRVVVNVIVVGGFATGFIRVFVAVDISDTWLTTASVARSVLGIILDANNHDFIALVNLHTRVTYLNMNRTAYRRRSGDFTCSVR